MICVDDPALDKQFHEWRWVGIDHELEMLIASPSHLRLLSDFCRALYLAPM